MSLYTKGDYVVHPGQGVCVVEGVVEHARSAEDDPALPVEEFYELYPASGARMRICFPVGNEETLRRPVGAREARDLIARMPGLDDDMFTDQHGWTVEEHFMASVRGGACEDVLRTLKTMHGRMEYAKAHGKKPSTSYARIYKAAHERATVELGFALHADPERVDRMIDDSFARARA